MRTRILAALLLVLAFSTACSGGGGTSSAGSVPRPVRGGQNLITEGEIAELGQGLESAFDIVERLRPTMLRSRAATFGTSQAGEAIAVIAYVDDVRLGETGNLRTVPRLQVREIRYVNATDATQRWGTGHGSGVIQVISRK
ncbi:MAG: hypothetical protein ACT4OZ_12180 [Gemmatimonadota bacterium]